jgi:hypothetical protein
VKEHKRTEEQQKVYIFDIFSKCRSETAPGRLQVYFPTLCEQIYLWYKDYLSVDIDDMGLVISQVINRFTKAEKIKRIPNDKDGFFKYLNTSIDREKTNLYYEYNEKDTIRYPKEIKQRIKKVEDFIRMKESQNGKELTYNECIQGISKWFNISESNAREYLELSKNRNVRSLDFININGEEENILDSNDLKSSYCSYSNEEPESALFTNFNESIIREAVTSVLAKKQERAKPCIKALFTLYCIKNDLKELYPILDQEIIDSFHKHDKKPKQYEIYLKYHPETDKESAGVMAATNLREFLIDLETYLKKKNH